MKSLRYCVLFQMIILGLNDFAQPGSYYPPPGNVDYHNDTLTICPPDSLPGDPVVLMGYNIYVDSVFFDNIAVTTPTDTIDYIFTFPALPPGDHSFCANAVYNEWISEPACDSAIVIYGYELPFLEDWSSGSFEELQWTSSSGNWVISNEEGNPAPAAEFRSDPVQTNYTLNLESFPINATGLFEGKIWLDFDLKLDCMQPTGEEKLFIQIWNSTHNAWSTVEEYFNYDGSFTWSSEHIVINPHARNKVFKIRFQATGVNSADIDGWLIDNIYIYRKCDEASNLVLDEYADHNKLSWIGWGTCGGVNPWIHYDDGLNSGNSFGTGEPVEFDVAARWESAQLACFEGASVYQVAYFPVENTASYRIRIWTGTGPDTLICDESASPITGQWNTKTLVTPQPVDFKKDLWVGYHVSTPTGYPAGLDNGPAINGYGNMIRLEGAWKTLLEVNPALNYNWNITCYLWPTSNPPDPEVNYNIYRQTNNVEFQLYDVTGYDSYLDSNIILSDNYCYKVTVVWAKDGDTCESDPTNIVCETVNVGTDQPEQDNTLKIYPNPAKNWLNIKSEKEIRSIRLYNLIGENVLKLEIGNLYYQLDVSSLQDGIYYVMVVTEKRDFKAKIVILR
jgi:hypothetical protein